MLVLIIRSIGQVHPLGECSVAFVDFVVGHVDDVVVKDSITKFLVPSFVGYSCLAQ